MSDLDVATELVKGFEGYISQAAYDVNHYRVGYGSDTEGPEQNEVTAFTTTTPERALANLKARIPQFIRTAIEGKRLPDGSISNHVGQDGWNALNDNQRAALTSIVYNYGVLPKRLTVDPLDAAGTAKRIADLAGDNSGINAKRRQKEAKLYLKPTTAPVKPTIPPVVVTGTAAGVSAGITAWLYALLTNGNATPALLAIVAGVVAFGVMAWAIHQLPSVGAPTAPAERPPTPAAPIAPPGDDMSAMMAELIARKDRAAAVHQAAIDADKAFADQLTAIHIAIDTLSKGLHEIADSPAPQAPTTEQ